jgi:hypothetical protein
LPARCLLKVDPTASILADLEFGVAVVVLYKVLTAPDTLVLLVPVLDAACNIFEMLVILDGGRLL